MELKFSGSIQDLPASDRLELLLDSVTDCAIYLLDRDGVIRTWNKGAERIKGYRAAEVIGQHFSLFFSREDKAANLPHQVLARAGSSGRAEQEGWRIRKDGGRFWASSVVQPVRDARGRAVGFAEITRDMTERREAQQALYESERRFRLLVQAVKDCAIYMLDPSGVTAQGHRADGGTARLPRAKGGQRQGGARACRGHTVRSRHQRYRDGRSDGRRRARAHAPPASTRIAGRAGHRV